MKNFKTAIFIAIFILFCSFVNVFALTSGSFSENSSDVQPPPPNIGKGFIHNIDTQENNPNQNNSEQQVDNSTNPIDTTAPTDEIINQLLNNIISCVDEYNHRLFVSEKENNRVLVFHLNPDNTLIDNIADHVLGQPDFLTITPGTTDAKFNMPQGIAYDHEDNLLFVADTGNNRIMVFDVSTIDNGESAANVLGQTTFTESDSGTTDSELNNPVGLVYNSNSDQLFVADTGNNRIMVFDVSTIDNGESATNVVDQSQDLSGEKNIVGKSGTSQPENNLSWIVFLSLIIISVSTFLLIKIIRTKN